MRGACAGAVLAVAATGCFGGADQDDGRQRLPRVHLIGTDLPDAGPPAIVAGQRVTFIGTVDQRTSRKAGLLASEYPYDRWRLIRTTPDASGIEFRVHPAINTRYRLRLLGEPPVRSNTQQVYVDLKGRLDAYLLGGSRVEYSYRGGAGVPVTPAEGRMHFYLQEDGRGPLRRIGAGRPRQGGVRSIVVTLRRSDPDPRQTDRFFSCAEGLLAKGFGHPAPSDPGCGKPELAATERRMTAGR